MITWAMIACECLRIRKRARLRSSAGKGHGGNYRFAWRGQTIRGWPRFLNRVTQSQEPPTFRVMPRLRIAHSFLRPRECGPQTDRRSGGRPWACPFTGETGTNPPVIASHPRFKNRGHPRARSSAGLRVRSPLSVPKVQTFPLPHRFRSREGQLDQQAQDFSRRMGPHLPS
jgi:hypothetical protein